MPKGKKAKPKGPTPAPLVARVQTAPLQTAYQAKVSNCAKDYMESMLAPWGPAAPCLPQAFPRTSRKIKTFVRSEVVIGTAGVGFVTCAPGRLISNTATCATVTTAAFTGTTTNFVVTSPGYIGLLANSPYATADLGATTCSYRLVTAGMRLMYTDAELSRGGDVTCIVEPDHQGLVAGLSTADLLAFDVAETHRPRGGDSWIELPFGGPVNPSELEFADDPLSTDPTAGGTQSNAASMVMMINGTPGLKYRVEIWANFELVGSEVRGKTMSHADVVGGTAAANAMEAAATYQGDTGAALRGAPSSQSSHERAANRSHKSFVSWAWSHLKNFVASQSSALVPYLKKEGLALAGKALQQAPALLAAI